MNNWWSGLSLKNKLQFPIQLILLLVLVLAQRVALDRFETNVLSEAQQKALISADGVLNGLNMLMINGIISDAEQRALYVKKMGSSDHVNELRVMRNKPVQDQFGLGLPSEQPVDELDHAALQTAKVQTQLSDVGGVHSLRVVVPFIAHKEFRGTNCLMCHNVPEGTVNGAASITLDLTQEFDVMRNANYVMWAVQLAVQLFLYFVIGWLISFMTRPVRELQLTMQDMQVSGDLSKRVRVRGQDEIGQTGQAFNDLPSCKSCTWTRRRTLPTTTGRSGTPTKNVASPSTATTSAACTTRRPSRPSPTRCMPRALARRKPPGDCVTGASAASATGARPSPSSIATRAARCPCRKRTWPSCCPKTWCQTAAATR